MKPNQQDPPAPFLSAASLRSQPVLTEAHNINRDVLSSGVLCLPGGSTWSLFVFISVFLLHVLLCLQRVPLLWRIFSRLVVRFTFCIGSFDTTGWIRHYGLHVIRLVFVILLFFLSTSFSVKAQTIPFLCWHCSRKGVAVCLQLFTLWTQWDWG